jgi:hypothetical protein
LESNASLNSKFGQIMHELDNVKIFSLFFRKLAFKSKIKGIWGNQCMESEVISSEGKLVRKLILDWPNQLNGIATSPMRLTFALSSSLLTLLILPWKVRPSSNDAK